MNFDSKCISKSMSKKIYDNIFISKIDELVPVSSKAITGIGLRYLERKIWIGMYGWWSRLYVQRFWIFRDFGKRKKKKTSFSVSEFEVCESSVKNVWMSQRVLFDGSSFRKKTNSTYSLSREIHVLYSIFWLCYCLCLLS